MVCVWLRYNSNNNNNTKIYEVHTTLSVLLAESEVSPVSLSNKLGKFALSFVWLICGIRKWSDQNYCDASDLVLPFTWVRTAKPSNNMTVKGACSATIVWLIWVGESFITTLLNAVFFLFADFLVLILSRISHALLLIHTVVWCRICYRCRLRSTGKDKVALFHLERRQGAHLPLQSCESINGNTITPRPSLSSFRRLLKLFCSSDNCVNNINYCFMVLKCLALSTTLILANWTEPLIKVHYCLRCMASAKPGLWLPSQHKSWYQMILLGDRGTCVNSLPTVAPESPAAGIRTRDLLIATSALPLGHQATQWCRASINS